jgi:two-component system cell cycle response regulator
VVVTSLLKRGPLSKRSEPREDVHTRARIVFGDGSIECIIKDASKRGARLRVDNAMNVPPQFELVWPGGHRRTVTVRWRRKGEIGVVFLERRAFGQRG